MHSARRTVKVTGSVTSATDKVTGSVSSVTDKLPSLPKLPDLPSVGGGGGGGGGASEEEAGGFGLRLGDKVNQIKSRKAERQAAKPPPPKPKPQTATGMPEADESDGLGDFKSRYEAKLQEIKARDAKRAKERGDDDA